MRGVFLLAGLGLAASVSGMAVAQKDAPPALPPAKQSRTEVHRAPTRLPATRAEVQTQVREQFAALDKNRDGYLTRDELPLGRPLPPATPPPPGGAGGPDARPDIDRLFAMMDKDGNGQISKDEFAAFHAGGQRIERWSSDERRPDGKEVHREHVFVMRSDGAFAPMHARGRMHDWKGIAAAMMFRNADKDQDGRVSLAEAETAALARFDRADANHDGVLSDAEREAVRSRLAMRFRERRFGHGPGRWGDMPPPPPPPAAPAVPQGSDTTK